MKKIRSKWHRVITNKSGVIVSGKEPKDGDFVFVTDGERVEVAGYEDPKFRNDTDYIRLADIVAWAKIKKPRFKYE